MKRSTTLSIGLGMLFLAALAFISGCKSPTEPPTRDVTRGQWSSSIQDQGVERDFLLYTPSSYQEGRAWPLVVVLHGGYGDANRTVAMTRFNALADKEGFLVLYPEAAGRNWNDGRFVTRSDVDDVLFINRLLDHISQRRNMDAEQIYVTGPSNGGMMAQRLACESAGRFAAFAAVVANLPVALYRQCKPGEPVPMLLIHSVDDPLMPWDGGAIAQGRRSLGRRHGEVISGLKTADFWLRNCGCDAESEVERILDRNPTDAARAKVSRYSDCSRGCEIVHIVVDGGGHAWPGTDVQPRLKVSGTPSQDFSATELIWEFFERHRRGGAS